MKLRWRDVHEQPQGIDLNETIELPNLVKENRQVISMRPVVVDLHAQEVSHTLSVLGALHTEVTYRCSRCLTETELSLDVPFSEQFVRTEQEMEEDEDRILVTGDTIEFDPYLEQEILLAMPLNPVCEESCAGLCPVCGINRNEQTCNCTTERMDPRLADLAKLLNPE
ncbi:YceD family protein [Effusibacillus dendaii]|uniref:DUF177 domain-containing protein n=1 Tax=Effusibacillus dendaii TaxID=2743772 RepID=A0A7I8DB52_9BACL|nr:DUF177 domain-containing protein [Effusibacillus dendaii]BCJ85141.1 hypothetical protein skT53_01260 [Effusibacillus dendaii]